MNCIPIDGLFQLGSFQLLNSFIKEIKHQVLGILKCMENNYENQTITLIVTISSKDFNFILIEFLMYYENDYADQTIIKQIC